MRIIEDIELAKSTLLKRLPAEDATLPEHVRKRIGETFGEDLQAAAVVERIIADVRDKGDAGLLTYVEKLDGASLSQLEVPREEIASAEEKVDASVVSALRIAAQRVRQYHDQQRNCLPIGMKELGDGVGQILAPLERVGVYAPGGTASYPSTVLMTIIPAKAAGVDSVMLASPPKPNGHISSLTLAAAAIAGADRVFAMGGAHAIAAFAYGTRMVPKADKICGPGNIFVMLAKKQVFGAVDIDGLQGPTETLVLADDSADPAACAADLLAQGEHDELSSAIMITTSKQLALEVSNQVEQQLETLERSSIAGVSLEKRGGIVITNSIEQSIDLVNAYAPEHLCLLVRDAQSVAKEIRHAGGIFVGESSPEVMGDYIAGPSHVMPTGGTARFTSPLNVLDFLKVTSVIGLNEESLRQLGPAAATIARAEGLTAHSSAIEIRLRPH